MKVLDFVRSSNSDRGGVSITHYYRTKHAFSVAMTLQHHLKDDGGAWRASVTPLTECCETVIAVGKTRSYCGYCGLDFKYAGQFKTFELLDEQVGIPDVLEDWLQTSNVLARMVEASELHDAFQDRLHNALYPQLLERLTRMGVPPKNLEPPTFLTGTPIHGLMDS